MFVREPIVHPLVIIALIPVGAVVLALIVSGSYVLVCWLLQRFWKFSCYTAIPATKRVVQHGLSDLLTHMPHVSRRKAKVIR